MAEGQFAEASEGEPTHLLRLVLLGGFEQKHASCGPLSSLLVLQAKLTLPVAASTQRVWRLLFGATFPESG